MCRDLYVHFPFCRGKCRYCALHSRGGVAQSDRNAYVVRLASELDCLFRDGLLAPCLSSVYFGGGTPALCDLSPMLSALRGHLGRDCEFTVELHPLDVTGPLLSSLADEGVNRISMGVQSLSDETLSSMGRGYSAAEARRAFDMVVQRFPNAGIDLIVGYPGDIERTPPEAYSALREWGLSHCSVYAIQNERALEGVASDDAVLDTIEEVSATLGSFGLERYEISNYAVPGRECRHNLAVWRGADYFGLGEGACGRIGLRRTRNWASPSAEEEAVSEEFDRKERRLFSLRTKWGLDATGFPEWRQALGRHVEAGLLSNADGMYRLTKRGREVCDAVLSDLV